MHDVLELLFGVVWRRCKYSFLYYSLDRIKAKVEFSFKSLVMFNCPSRSLNVMILVSSSIFVSHSNLFKVMALVVLVSVSF